MWETDEALGFTTLSPAAAAAIGKVPADLHGKPLTRLFPFHEGEDGALPILNALAEKRRFDDQFADLRTESKARYRLSAVPLIDGAGRFAGFRGAASSLPKWLPEPPANDAAPSQPPLKDSPAFGERLDKALRVPLDHIIPNAETTGAQPRPEERPVGKDSVSTGRYRWSPAH